MSLYLAKMFDHVIFVHWLQCSSMYVEWYFTWIKSERQLYVSMKYLSSSNPNSGSLEWLDKVLRISFTVLIDILTFRIETHIEGDGFAELMDCFIPFWDAPLAYLNVSGPSCAIYPNKITSYIFHDHYWWSDSSIQSKWDW